jgi:F-type H+-transporting ATPase subunit delta
MPAASRDALVKLRENPALADAGAASSATLIELADDLFGIGSVLVGQPQLRRTLGDPATDPDGRAGLVARLLDGKVSALAIELTQAAVRLRWSSPWDLADSLELMANDSLFAAAESQNSLDEVEDQLFRFERILDAESSLTTLLDEQVVPASRRVALLEQVLGQKVGPITLSLLSHAVSSERTHGVTNAVHDLLDEASARRERSVARVLSAVELSASQETRLAAALTELYGRVISVRTAVDPSLRGGLVIQVGDEVIDGSVASRLANVKAALAV